MTRESADELMIRRFAGAQRDCIGRFVADSVSGRWSWSDDIFEIFGYRAGSVTPSWSLIISHIPPEDRAVAQAAYELATTRVGPFCWSHRIHVGDAMRSILVLGETSRSMVSIHISGLVSAAVNYRRISGVKPVSA